MIQENMKYRVPEIRVKKKWIWLALCTVILLCIFGCSNNVFAATDNSSTSQITSAFDSIYSIIAAIVSSIGQLYLLWGVFEWATALNSQDGASQSMAFKRISAGLVACLAPQIISMIKI